MTKIAAMKFKYLLMNVVVLLCLNSCKKNSPAPASVTILGKWFNVKRASKIYNNGVQVDSVYKTSYTGDDFVEYYKDGTGYFSSAGATGPSLKEFTYTLTGTALTEFTSVELNGVPMTITILTAGSLSIHEVSLISDPNDPTITDTEISDYTFRR